MSRQALLVVALLLPTHVLGQVDIESLRPEGAPEGVSGTLGGDLTVKTGNTDLVETDLSSRLDWVQGDASTLFVAQGGLGLLGDENFSSSGLAHLRHTRWLGDRIAPEAYAQVNYDRPLLLDFRTLVGAGLRVRLSRGDWGTFGAGVSVMLEDEWLDLPPSATHPDRTRRVRNSTFLTARLAGGDAFVVSSTAYVQPAIEDPGDLRILGKLGVASSLTDRLALTVSLDLRYDSGPPDGLAALDTRLKTGVTFTY
jgi:hypothetical protein